MKYSVDEQIKIILGRGDLLKRKKERRITNALGSAASVIAIMLMLSIGHYAGGSGMTVSRNYGSFLVGEEAGGYVLVGLLAFLFGVVLTAFIYRRRYEHRR